MSILDTFKSDSAKFEERRAKFERVSPLFEEAKQALSVLEKDYPEAVTPELRDLFWRVGKKVEDESWFVGTWQPKGQEISLPSFDTGETTPLSPPLVRGETSIAGETPADADRGFLGKAVDMVMNGAIGARQGFSDMMGAVSRSGQNITGALGTLAGEATKDSPLGVSVGANALKMLSGEFGKAADQWGQYGTDPSQYPEGFQRTMAKIAKGVNEAVGHAAVDIPAIMTTPGGLTAYSGGMAMAEGLQKGEKGWKLAKTAGKGALHGALLHGILKSLGYLPKSSQIAGGAAVFGGPAVQEELAKPKGKRDYTRVFTELLTGGGLMAFGGKTGKSYKELYQDAVDFYGKKKIETAKKKVKDFVEEAERKGQSAEQGEKISFDDLLKQEGEILRLVGEINSHAKKMKEGEKYAKNVPGVKEKVPGGRHEPGRGEEARGEDLQRKASGETGAPGVSLKEKGKEKAERLAEIDRGRIEFERMKRGEREFVRRFLKYRDEQKEQVTAKVKAEKERSIPLTIKRKPVYRGENKIELLPDERVMFEAEFGNLKLGKVIKGGLREVEHVGEGGVPEKVVVGRFATESTNPEWYRDSGVLLNYGKNRILPVMNKALKGLPLTDKQMEIYDDIRTAIDDYGYKVVNEYLPKSERIAGEATPLGPPLSRGETKQAEFEKAVSPEEMEKMVFEPSTVKGEKETVFYDDLKEGDKFTINGEEFEVKQKERGVMKVEDGVTYTLEPDFSPLDIDKGSIYHKGTKTQIKEAKKSKGEIKKQEKVKVGEKPGIKVEKTEAGDQFSFKPGAEMPRGKKKITPGQKRVEQQEGGLFEAEKPKGKQERLFTGKTQGAEREIRKYVNMIKNENKKAYARKYGAWALGGRKGEAPSPGKLGAMGEQAVRIAIEGMVGKYGQKGAFRTGADYGGYKARERAPIFYSKAEKAVKDRFPEKMNAPSVKNWLSKQNVKPEELDWLDIESLTAGKKNVTKQELLDWIAGNKIIIREIIKGEKYNRNDELKKVDKLNKEIDNNKLKRAKLYEESYEREYLGKGHRTLKEIQSNIEKVEIELEQLEDLVYHLKIDINEDVAAHKNKWSDFQTEGSKNYREVLLILPSTERFGTFQSSHWDDIPNVIAHARITEHFYNQDKILFIEEIQSDWHQKGKKMGYKNEIPNAPFKSEKAWSLLVMKRMIRWAAENGFDKIAWTPGIEQVKRYKKEISNKKGMIEFYDRKLPSYVNKFIKKFGSTVEVSEMGKLKALSFPITNEMRDVVLYKGQELFEKGGYKKGTEKGYEPNKVSLFEMPEIVEFVQRIKKGEYPKIFKDMRALGRVVSGADVQLRADIFIGERLTREIHKSKFDISDEIKQKYADKYNVDVSDLRFRWRYKNNKHVLDVYQYDPTLAPRVLSHEIGHVVDYIPEETWKRGNILGHLASLKKYMKTLLEEYEGAPGKVLTPADRERIRAEARKLTGKEKEIWVEREIKKELDPITVEDILAIWRDTEAAIKDPELNKYVAGLSSAQKKSIVKEAMKGRIPEWFGFKKRVKIVIEKVLKKVPIKNREQAIREKYQELIKEEIRKRRLFERDEIMDELKKITQIWKPFDAKANPKYTKYRHSSVELYADAFSMLMNDPAQLKKTAPSFWKAFFNYFERKPEVKEVWEEIQSRIHMGKEAILAHRGERIREMFKKEKELYAESLEKETLRSNFKKGIKEIQKFMLDRDYYAKQEVRKVVRETRKTDRDKARQLEDVSPIDRISELPHLSSVVYQMVMDVQNDVLKAGKKLGLSEGDVGELLFERRIVHERKEMANPILVNPQAALEQMGYFERQIGKEKFSKLIELVEKFREIREKDVLPILDRSKMFHPELRKQMKDNKFYATWDVQKYMNKRYGKRGTAKIFRQYGTLQEIGNPLGATILKDAALIKAAERNMITEDYVKFMLTYSPEAIKTPGKGDFVIRRDKDGNVFRMPRDPVEADLGLITYMKDGKVNGFYVNKEIADTFDRNPVEAGVIYRGVQKSIGPWRQIYVRKNFGWALWNMLYRDPKRAAKLIHGETFSGILFREAKSLPEVWRLVFKNQASDVIRQMNVEKALPFGRKYGRVYAHDPETQADAEMMRYITDGGKYKNVVIRLFRKIADFLDGLADVSEKTPKVATYKGIVKRAGKKRGLKPTVTKRAAMVRELGGSPDFSQGGTLRWLYNTLFLFSNAGTQDWRSGFQVYGDNLKMMKDAWIKKDFGAGFQAARQGVIWKTVKYDIMPKTVMAFAALGGLKYLGDALGDDRLKKEGEWLERAFQYIPDYDKTNYLCIPMGFTKSGKVIYMVQPHDYMGQVVAGAYWKIIMKNQDGYRRSLADHLTGGIPYQSLTPPPQLMLDVFTMMTGGNPYDNWYGRKLISEDKFNAGGATKWKEFFKQEWNRFGGRVIYYFPYDDLDRVSSELGKVINIPVVGNYLRRFLRVSDRGYAESMLYSKEMQAEEKRASRENIRENELIVNYLNKGVVTSRADAARLWRSLKGTGMDMESFGTFYNKYVKYVGRKKGDIVFNILQAAETNAKRRIVLEKMLKRKVDIGEVPGIWKRLKYEVLKK